MATYLEASAKLLREAADIFRNIAAQDLSVSDSMNQRADLYEELSRSAAPHALEAQNNSTSVSSGPTREDPWIQRPRWLKRDRPVWVLQEDLERPLWRDHQPDDQMLEAALYNDFGEALKQYKDGTILRFAEPAFLPGVVLAHVARSDPPGWDALFSVVKVSDGKYKARSFNFRIDEISRLNKSTPLRSVGFELEYLRYYMYVVRGDAGAFRLLEGEVMDEAGKFLDQKVLDDIERPRFVRVTAGGRAIFAAHVLYAGTVFKVELAVSPDGNVEMLNDDQVFEKTIPELLE